jgi:hypothetical protein
MIPMFRQRFRGTVRATVILPYYFLAGISSPRFNFPAVSSIGLPRRTRISVQLNSFKIPC